MNTQKLFAYLLLLLAGSLLLISCATTASVDEELLVGTWLNQEPGRGTKAIFSSDGKVLYYVDAASAEPNMEARYTIEEKWTDEEGNVYHKVLETWSNYPYNEAQAVEWYKLYMIHPSGDVLEGNWSQIRYPEEITPGQDYYHVDVRQ